MRARLIGGALILSAIAGIIALDLEVWPRVPISLVIGTLGLLAALEYTRLLARGGLPVVRTALMAAAAIHFASELILELEVGSEGVRVLAAEIDVGALAIALLLLCLVRGIVRQDVQRGFDAAVWTLTGYLWVPAALYTLIEIRRVLPHPDGVWLLIFVVAVSKVGDICGYFVGRAIGRRKAIPGISPGKTVAGCTASLVGAVLLAVLLGFGLGILPPGVGLPGAIGAGIIINLAAQFGDLAASLLKRRVGAKDSAALLPGFGGVIDVVDSLLFAGPAFLAWLACCA